MSAAGVAVVACQPKTVVVKETVEVEVEKVVKETVEVEKVVKETVEVEKVVKETIEVQVTVAPGKVREAPELFVQVSEGKLPPVEERLPVEPLVVTPIEEIGQYGSTWRQLHMGMVDTMQNWYSVKQRMTKYSRDFTEFVPNVAKEWEFSDGGRSITVFLRKGAKWDDGDDFTTDDVMYWWEDEVGNDELSPTKPSNLRRSGELATLEKVDDYSFKITFMDPYGAFEDQLPKLATFSPGHYLRQFHAAYADKAELDAAMKEAEVDTWTDLYGTKTALSNNPGTPDVSPWAPRNAVDEPVQTWPRNAYYWKVDTEGNQLPYIDRIERTLLPDTEAILLKAIAGDTDFQARRVSSLGNRPVVAENQEKGDYRVIPTLSPGTNYGTIYFNYSHKDQVLRDLFHELNFRIALSLGIDRDEINTLIFKGQANPGQATAGIGAPWYKKEFSTTYAEYDPDKANDMLDALGLTEKDAEGYRLRSDGQRLSMVNLAFTPWPDDNVEIQEMIKGQWEKIGVEMIVKPTDRQLWVTQVHALEHDIASYAANLGFFGNPPIVRETFCINEGGHHWAPQWGLWYQTGGQEGEEPPEEIKQLQNMYEQIMGEVSTQKRNEMQTDALAMHMENVWQIGIVGEPDLGRFCIVKNNFRNVPEEAFDQETLHPGTFFIKS